MIELSADAVEQKSESSKMRCYYFNAREGKGETSCSRRFYRLRIGDSQSVMYSDSPVTSARQSSDSAI